MDAATELDLDDLERYLSTHLGVEVIDMSVLHDGLNLSLAISTPHTENAYVLRRPNKLRHTELFNSVHQEYQILERLQETAVPAPDPVHYCADPSILGEPFLVMTHLHGDAIPLGSDLPGRFQHERARRHVSDALIETLAGIHTVDPEPFETCCERYSTRDEIAHATERLETATEITGHEVPTLWEVSDWLQANAPSDPELAVIHGDFRPGNVLFAGEERPELTGVLDWETAIFGDPLAELGYFLLRWRDPGDPTPDLTVLEARHPDSDAIETLRTYNERGMSPFTAAPGSPTRRDLVTRYEELTGTGFEHARYYRAHAAFVLATVWADLHRSRVEAGQESDWEPSIEYMAMVAESIVAGEFTL